MEKTCVEIELRFCCKSIIVVVYLEGKAFRMVTCHLVKGWFG